MEFTEELSENFEWFAHNSNRIDEISKTILERILNPLLSNSWVTWKFLDWFHEHGDCEELRRAEQFHRRERFINSSTTSATLQLELTGFSDVQPLQGSEIMARKAEECRVHLLICRLRVVESEPGSEGDLGREKERES